MRTILKGIIDILNLREFSKGIKTNTCINSSCFKIKTKHLVLCKYAIIKVLVVTYLYNVTIISNVVGAIKLQFI